MKSALLAAAALYSGSAFAASNYSLVKQYSGQSFFDGWVFYDYYDNTTSGTFFDRSVLASSCAYIPSAMRHVWQALPCLRPVTALRIGQA